MDSSRRVDQKRPFVHQGGIDDSNVEKKSSSVYSHWNKLPAVVLHKVFSLLTHQNRINSSAVCWDWRAAFFHPCFWTEITFRLGDVSKKSWTKFLVDLWAHSVQNATVQCHIPMDIQELEELLRQFRVNTNLKQLIIDPTLTTVESGRSIHENDVETWGKSISRSIVAAIGSSRKLEVLSIGYIEPLLGPLDVIVNQLAKYHRKNLIHLSVASTIPKDDLQNYPSTILNPLSFKGFERLTTLTLDYEYVNDALLLSLDSGTLERVVVHVHNWTKEHPGTTNPAWRVLRSKNPRCELRLNFLHAHAAIEVAHERILKPAMPLSHFKALFCIEASMRVIYQLRTWYADSLKSLVWIDSIRYHMFQWPTDDSDINYAIDSISDDNIMLREFFFFGHRLLELPAFGGMPECDEMQLYVSRLRPYESGEVIIYNTEIEPETSIQGDIPYDLDKLENDLKDMVKEAVTPPLNADIIPVFMEALRGDTRNLIRLLLLEDMK